MLDEHLGYLRDAKRLAKYKQAINLALRRGDSIVDLGCGTGVLGLLCLPDRAYEIESGPVISVARESFERCGFASKATFIQSRTFVAEIPHEVDLAISDHVGYFGIDYDIVELLHDARTRFLRPGGKTIPEG